MTCSICSNDYINSVSINTEDVINNSHNKCDFICDNGSKCKLNSKKDNLCNIHNLFRTKLTCPSCLNDCCKICYRTYFLTSSEDPHCIHCKKGFTIEFLLGYQDNVQRFSNKFVWGALKIHRENILLDRIMSRMPTFQKIATEQIINEKNKIKSSKIYEIINKLTHQNYQIINKIIIMETYQLDCDKLNRLLFKNKYKINKLYSILSNIYKSSATENSHDNSNKINGKCINNNCNGYINNEWKCGVCFINICSKCMSIKEKNHECNPDEIESIRLLKDISKPCPGCNQMIERTMGCCFAKDTKILMYDGTIKMSQDIKIGDILVGDDGNKRMVQDCISGIDKMYKVTQNNGDAYIVNSKHILVLVDPKNKIHQITVDDYMALSDFNKSKLFGIKSSKGINYEEQQINIDPYMLGLWLGDGTHTHPVIASNDIEIQQYLVVWCENNDAELIHEEGIKFAIRRKGNSNGKNTLRKAIGYTSCEECKACKIKRQEICNYRSNSVFLQRPKRSKTNPLLEQLKEYNLIGNKHIPRQFLMNSRTNRLKLLAGLIDTDGTVNNKGKRAIIIQTKPELSEQIILLARSLGFVVNVSIRKRENESIFNGQKKDYKSQYCINISGNNLSEIPTLLPRKQCYNSTQNSFKSKIKVEYIEKNEFFGWQIDQNKLFIAPDFTILHNCQMWCTNCHNFFDWNTLKLIKKTQYVHNPEHIAWLANNINTLNNQNNQDNILNPCDINYRLLQNLPLNDNKNKIIEIFRISNEIRENVENYIDPLDQNIEKYSVDFIRSKISKNDLKKIIQKNYKASKKKELTNMYKMMYVDNVNTMLAHFINEIRHNNTNINILYNNTVILLSNLYDYISNNLNNIGKIFNSNPPKLYNINEENEDNEILMLRRSARKFSTILIKKITNIRNTKYSFDWRQNNILYKLTKCINRSELIKYFKNNPDWIPNKEDVEQAYIDYIRGFN